MPLYQELKRRNVFRVAIAYLAVAWLLTEVAGTLFPVFGIPDWGIRFMVIVFALGFVPAMVISWIYEMTPEGLRLEKDVVRDDSITHLTARRLDVFTISLIVVALAFILADRFWMSPRRTAEPAVTAEALTDKVQTQEPETRYPTNSIAVLPFVNMSDYRAAAKHYQHALKFGPANPEILAMAAIQLESLGRLKETIALREYLVTNDPANSRSHFYLGFAYLLNGQPNNAITSFQTVLALKPSYVSAHYRIGVGLLSKGEAGAALTEMKLEPNRAYRWFGLTMAYYATGQQEESDATLVAVP